MPTIKMEIFAISDESEQITALHNYYFFPLTTIYLSCVWKNDVWKDMRILFHQIIMIQLLLKDEREEKKEIHSSNVKIFSTFCVWEIENLRGFNCDSKSQAATPHTFSFDVAHVHVDCHVYSKEI
jgi:hypothetical protein